MNPACGFFYGLLFLTGPAAAPDSPYPRLLRNIEAGLRAELDSGLGQDIEIDPLMRKLGGALLDNQPEHISDALQSVGQMMSRLPEVEADHIGMLQDELLLDLTVAAEPLLTDSTMAWVLTRLRSSTGAGMLELRTRMIGRALLAHDQVAARTHLLQLTADAQADCRKADDEQRTLCDFLEGQADATSLESLNALLLENGPHTTPRPAARVLQTDPVLAYERCNREPDPMSLIDSASESANRADAVSIAVGSGDLDSAIAQLMHPGILLPDSQVDPRLPDLLLTRYGSAGIATEFANAIDHLQERKLQAGRAIVVHLFGSEMQLPARCLSPWAEATMSGKEQAVTEFTTTAQHETNLRRSALYRSLLDLRDPSVF